MDDIINYITKNVLKITELDDDIRNFIGNILGDFVVDKSILLEYFIRVLEQNSGIKYNVNGNMLESGHYKIDVSSLRDNELKLSFITDTSLIKGNDYFKMAVINYICDYFDYKDLLSKLEDYINKRINKLKVNEEFDKTLYDALKCELRDLRCEDRKYKYMYYVKGKYEPSKLIEITDVNEFMLNIYRTLGLRAKIGPFDYEKEKILTSNGISFANGKYVFKFVGQVMGYSNYLREKQKDELNSKYKETVLNEERISSLNEITSKVVKEYVSGFIKCYLNTLPVSLRESFYANFIINLSDVVNVNVNIFEISNYVNNYLSENVINKLNILELINNIDLSYILVTDDYKIAVHNEAVVLSNQILYLFFKEYYNNMPQELRKEFIDSLRPYGDLFKQMCFYYYALNNKIDDYMQEILDELGEIVNVETVMGKKMQVWMDDSMIDDSLDNYEFPTNEVLDSYEDEFYSSKYDFDIPVDTKLNRIIIAYVDFIKKSHFLFKYRKCNVFVDLSRYFDPFFSNRDDIKFFVRFHDIEISVSEYEKLLSDFIDEINKFIELGDIDLICSYDIISKIKKLWKSDNIENNDFVDSIFFNVEYMNPLINKFDEYGNNVIAINILNKIKSILEALLVCVRNLVKLDINNRIKRISSKVELGFQSDSTCQSEYLERLLNLINDSKNNIKCRKKEIL